MAPPRQRALELTLAALAFAVALLVSADLELGVRASADDEFANMDRPTAVKASYVLGVDTSLSLVNSPLLDNFYSARIDPHITVFGKNPRSAFFALIPLSFGHQGDENELALGSVEVGGFRLFRLRSRSWMAARVSLALPTASSSAASAVTNGVAALTRIGDLILGMPGTMSARTSVSMVASGDGFVARADLGLDIPVFEQSRLIDELSHTPIGRANLALALTGLDGNKELGLESINAIGTEDVLASFGTPDLKTTLHRLGVTLRQRTSSRNHVLALFTDPRSLFATDDGFTLTLVYQLTDRAGSGGR